MIRFLFKGVLRDKNRSLLPIIIVASGVMLTIMLSSWINGIFGDAIEMTAKFSTGHVNIMTKALAKNGNMQANDLALTGVSDIMSKLKSNYREMEFSPRIDFGGLIDISDKEGNTISQGPAFGFAMDFISGNKKDIERLDIQGSIIKGRIPDASNQLLISDEFADKLKVKPGDSITFMGSTMYGSLTFNVFKIAGTIRFGTPVLDKGCIMIDIKDAQRILDMDDAASEIMGFCKTGFYDEEMIDKVKEQFNSEYRNNNDEFAPQMLGLRDQQNMDFMLDWIDKVGGIMIFFFVFAMSIILWNTGLLGGIRRYNEFGIRLAVGERKSHIYFSLLIESVFIGLISGIIGTILGLLVSYWMQNHGLNMGETLKNSSMMLPRIYRAKVESYHYYIGLIPGILSVFIGTALAGLAIYKRQTASLFKELES